MDAYQFSEAAAPKGAPLLVLLHGTGGDDAGMLALGRRLMPEAHLLAPRGDVSEHGAMRYFRRTGEGVYDMTDLARATGKMSDFLGREIDAIAPSSVNVLGYSNGANMLAAVLISGFSRIDRAVLMHPLIPFTPAAQPALKGRKVLISAGRHDPIAPANLTEQFADYLLAQGAQARLSWQTGGHEIGAGELASVREFLAAA